GREQLKKSYSDLVESLRPSTEVKIRADLEEMIKKEIRLIQQELDGLRGLEEGLEKQVKDLEKQVKDLDPAARPQGVAVVKLLKDVEQLGKESSELRDKIYKLKAEPKTTSRVVRLQNAEAPPTRDYSRLARFAVPAGLGM